MAATTRDRQLVAIATAHLRGERELVDALARDHLVDHPDNVLVAWIAGASHSDQGAVMNRKLTASLLILAAVLANVGFTALGSIFNYPDVLDEPAGKVLAVVPRPRGRRQRLVLGPGALRRAARSDRDRRRAPLVAARAMRIAVPVGIAAAVVQVIGLLRWPILVPGYASDAASGDAASRPPPRLVHDGERHPRHGHRRDARLPAHRHVDGARHRRARAALRRPLVPGAGRGVRGARPRRRPLAARAAR